MEIERFIVSKGIIINYISLRFDEVFFFLPFLLPGKLAKQREIQLTATKKEKEKNRYPNNTCLSGFIWFTLKQKQHVSPITVYIFSCFVIFELITRDTSVAILNYVSFFHANYNFTLHLEYVNQFGKPGPTRREREREIEGNDIGGNWSEATLDG